ncbi:MAG TPA: tRNA (guanosine(46)-N7)-methyltransferase TrmB [Vicingus sp.]|nr:MAG: tRNA (guanosine(46)-N7)-methyltransferase TrmB [Flavobacteriales bacterium]MBE7442708.1 tRNA (guanosine(46)-N7)-methyltransferase TrmB [Flavobacteriales bacterium]MCL4856246.1 tRNA (guanosine(46)-N7)-methyltransferase TrmB [Flavobacteriales bacterium]HRN41984.1 tRNA (guanosine(46)-N7)-methyltransferase TrmB [Vicingus sp.]HRP60308.1 tRNA (guanosine(46)-N7)-methyltransferase TrmB [Vicingus sp.]
MLGEGKKIERWKEMETFPHVLQAKFEEVFNNNHSNKGNWQKEVLKNNNPIVLELGCGRGEYSVGLAKHFPEKNFIGIDIKGARIWKGAKQALDQKLSNVFFIRTRIDFINSFFAENEVDELWITFPDPQPQETRERKRLTAPMFMERYKQLLKPNGIIHLKTDNEGFFRYTLEEIERNNYHLIEHTFDLYGEKIETLDPKTQEILSIKTYYENLFSAKGHKIHYLRFRF